MVGAERAKKKAQKGTTMENQTEQQQKPRQRADGAQMTLSPTDRKVLLLAMDAYRRELQRGQNKVKAKPELFDVYEKMLQEAAKTLKAIG